MAKRGRGQPAKGRLRLTIWIPKDLDRAIRREARTRETTLSDLVIEAFAARSRWATVPATVEDPK